MPSGGSSKSVEEEVQEDSEFVLEAAGKVALSLFLCSRSCREGSSQLILVF